MGGPGHHLVTPIMMMMGIDDGDHEDYGDQNHQATGFNANVFGWALPTGQVGGLW